MPVTTQNYFSKISQVDKAGLSPLSKEGYLLIKEKTNNGKDWAIYHRSLNFKYVFDLLFAELEKDLKKQIKMKEDMYSLGTVKRQKKRKPLTPPAAPANLRPVKYVERIPEELRFIRRFVNLNGKAKTREEVLLFINSLQRAIIERRIRKISPFAKEIEYIQESLINIYNEKFTGKRYTFNISPTKRNMMLEIINSEKIMPSVRYLKKGVRVSGKPGMKTQAERLLKTVEKSIKNKQIKGNDPHYGQLKELQNSLTTFVSGKGAKGTREMSVRRAALSGKNLMDDDDEGETALNGWNMNQLPLSNEPVIMNSEDFVKMKFPTMGFTGKWLEFMGDPAPGFRVMVEGDAKVGKSILSTDFAGYFTRNFGRGLYISKEEGFNHTLQIKLKGQDIANPNLDVCEEMPDDLNGYDLVVIDSVTSLNLRPEDLAELEQRFPTICFWYIHQVTKDGKGRGSNVFSHNADILIKFPKVGFATQTGRYGPPAEMQIMLKDASAGLNGIRDNITEKKYKKPSFDFATDETGKSVKIIHIDGKDVFTSMGVYHADKLFIDDVSLLTYLQKKAS
jgi:hypothetical protein